MPTTGTRARNSVAVQYAAARRGLPSAASLRKWAGAVRAGVLVRIVGEREGRALNRAFRKRDYATNVLSFPCGGGRGDIVLCHPVIAREARAQGKTLAAHYAHLVVHGVLHLRGYHHAKKAHAARMEREEARRLRRLGFENPYALDRE
ncbi:MAG: rRNA maturation RNase YbeY [Betaproteobacteria bacterium]